MFFRDSARFAWRWRRPVQLKGKSIAISLYDLSVLTFLQIVRAVGDFLDRAVKHCAETGAEPDAFVQARLFHDMRPLSDRGDVAPLRVGV